MKRLTILFLLFTVGCTDTTDYQPLQTHSRQINPEWVVETIERQQDIEQKLIRLLTALQESETRTIDFSKLNK